MLISITDYSTSFLNDLILIEEEVLQEEENYIFESLSLLLSGSTLTEAGKFDNLREYFKKFRDAIVNIFNRFIENIKKLFKVNEDWLKKNKETILNADLTDFMHEIYPYWSASDFAKRIDDGLPPLSDMVINQIIKKGCNKEVFTSECLKKIGLGNKNIRPGSGFEEDLQTVLRGNYSKKIRGLELKKQLPSIVDYCLDYDDEYKKVQRLHKTITDACTQGMNKVSAGARTIDPNNSKENEQKIEESYLFESTILLEEINNNTDIKQPNKGAAELAKQKGSAQNVTELNKRNKENKNEPKQVENKTDKQNNSSDNNKDLLSAIKVFLDVEQKFFTVRITIMEEKFKVYMSLLRKIVETVNGKSTDESDEKSKKENKKK